MESKNKIPSYVFVLVMIFIVAIIYLFLVQIPFAQNQPKLEEQHQKDASQIAIYEEANAKKEDLRSEVASMKKQYSNDSQDLFINAFKSPQDIMDMLKKSKTQPSSYSVSEQTVDEKSRKSSTGDPLYSTNVSITFDSLDDTQIKSVINYFESASKGAYFVDSVKISAIERLVDNSGSTESSSDEKENSKSSSKNEISSLYFTGKYQVTMTLKLYYFLPADQTPEAIKKALEETSKDTTTASSTDSSNASESSAA